MAAVQDPPIDTLVSKPRAGTTFAARRASLRLVMVPEYPILNATTGRPSGQVTGGIRIPFTDGQLWVPNEGEVTTENGKRIDAAEVLEWLRRHPLIGNRDEGFFEVPQVAPPVSDAETDRISELAMKWDFDGLTAMLEAERKGWERPGLMATIEKRLAQLEEYRREIEAQQAAEDKGDDEPPATRARAKK